MTQNYEKTWLASSLNNAAIKRAQNEIDATGKALPCVVTAVSGSIVTVSFEVKSNPYTIPNITIPKAEGPWIRSPTQIGDYGLTIPSQAYLGGISGLGGGTASIVPRANLSALVWIPVASTAFSTVDTSKAFVSGPGGVVAQTEDGTVSLTIEAGQIVLKAAGNTWTFGSAGLTMASGIVAETHVHGGVTPGSSDTGVPIS